VKAININSDSIFINTSKNNKKTNDNKDTFFNELNKSIDNKKSTTDNGKVESSTNKENIKIQDQIDQPKENSKIESEINETSDELKETTEVNEGEILENLFYGINIFEVNEVINEVKEFS